MFSLDEGSATFRTPVKTNKKKRKKKKDKKRDKKEKKKGTSNHYHDINIRAAAKANTQMALTCQDEDEVTMAFAETLSLLHVSNVKFLEIPLLEQSLVEGKYNSSYVVSSTFWIL